ncbi:MAG: UDP-N-acetylmuramoyl-L-alanyl-D-glutamate--2,6-diaminopimelate ligase, partial [Nakamurella sp.]
AGVPAGATAEITEIGDRGRAIRAAVAAAGPGDTVIIAGKGHEQGQYVGDRIVAFSDVDELTEALHHAATPPAAEEGTPLR